MSRKLIVQFFPGPDLSLIFVKGFARKKSVSYHLPDPQENRRGGGTLSCGGQGGRGSPPHFLERGWGRLVSPAHFLEGGTPSPPLMRKRGGIPPSGYPFMKSPLRRDSTRSQARVRAAGGGEVPCLAKDRGVGGPPLFFLSGGWVSPSHILDRVPPPLLFCVMGLVLRRGSMRTRGCVGAARGVGACLAQDKGGGGPPLGFWRGG